MQHNTHSTQNVLHTKPQSLIDDLRQNPLRFALVLNFRPRQTPCFWLLCDSLNLQLLVQIRRGWGTPPDVCV